LLADTAFWVAFYHGSAMPFAYRRRVEFRDTDAAGIVHFSVFFPMMEEAEHAALRHLGMSVLHPTGQNDHLTWPRVAAQCDFISPARFEETLRIEVTVNKIGTSSVTYGFAFYLEGPSSDPEAVAAGDSPGKLVARGSITTVCCLMTPGQPLQKRPIPDDVRQRLETLA
jgi:4-hydroxybenzoyl-CoA thioesterase/acyl-CoA thioester hydrolase